MTHQRFDDKAPTESVPLTFDFSADLLTGEILSGTPTISFATSLGLDLSAASLSNGSPGFDVTLSSVIVPVRGGLDGCEYTITVTTATSNPLKILTLVGILPVNA